MEVKVRVILAALTFSMFLIYQMSRFNINIAIVAIAHEELSTNKTLEFDAKPLLLGSYFWVCWITELIGAFVIRRYGCRIVMAISFILNAFCCFLFPLAYELHPMIAVVLRMVQGLINGFTWPTMAWISSRWIPKDERNRFMSTYHGATLGASLTNLCGGIIIDKLGWPSTFYVIGTLSVVWVLFWWPYAYDSPSVHPRISEEEKIYLEKHVEANISNDRKSLPVPWKNIFKSIPFWAVFSVYFSSMWFVITMAMQMPTYLDSVHFLNIKTNGLLLSIPDICKLIVGIKFPMIMDGLVKKGKLTINASRKISCAIGYLIPVVLMACLAFFGQKNVYVAITLIILSVCISGAGSSSLLANIVDISPNFASVLTGIAKTITNAPGILSPLAVKYILKNNDNDWCPVFLVTGVIVLSSTVFYLIFGTTDIQPWNNQTEVSEKKEENVDLLDCKKAENNSDIKTVNNKQEEECTV